MKPFQISRRSVASYGGMIERLEIFRTRLKWAAFLEESEKKILLGQCDGVRDAVLQLSYKNKFYNTDIKPTEQAETSTERRQALVERNFAFEGIFGDSPELLDALEISEKAAHTDLPILVDGESGTGKELMAKVIHANSERSNKPFISVNCGAIPESLFESELFGHKRGAFTGANADRKGKFESAHQGTIFLDEIGELSPQGQVKLLRVLQTQEIQRVGEDQPITVDARIVAATNRDLREMVEQGQFREDLFYRLSVIHVSLPSLKSRSDEIPLLLAYFCNEAAEELHRQPLKLSRPLWHFLLKFPYPGNIRELRNIVFRLSCLADDTADLGHLPEHMRPDNTTTEVDKVNFSLCEVKKRASDEAEKIFLENGLKQVSGKVTELAKLINMNRSHVQTLLKKHQLQSSDFKKVK